MAFSTSLLEFYFCIIVGGGKPYHSVSELNIQTQEPSFHPSQYWRPGIDIQLASLKMQTVILQSPTPRQFYVY